MADGSLRFNFPLPQRSKLRPGEIVVDLFAGGGGASEGLKQALGVSPPPMRAVAEANLDGVQVSRRAAA